MDLRRWQSFCDRCEKASKDCTCRKASSPSADYLFDEAARFRGYTQMEWDRESVRNKGRVLAHFLEHSLRESFTLEQARADGKKKPPGTTDWARHRQGRD